MCAKIVFLQNCLDVKIEVFERKVAFLFFFFCWRKRNRNKKKQMDKGPKNYKMVFLRWSSKNEKNEKWILAKFAWH